MNQSGSSIKEKIKSVILVVLFLFTILLLYFFWQDSKFPQFSLEDLGFRDNNEEAVAIRDLIVPSHIDICFDNETYTKVSRGREAYWDGEDMSLLESFKSVIASEDTYIEEITEEQYEEIMKFASIRAVFEYYLPFGEYCSFLGLDNPRSTDAVASISELGFSSGSTESMFIYDRANDEYFRIVSDFSAEELLDKAKELSTAENQTYYPLEQYVGSDLKGRVLIPSILETDLAEVFVSRDFGEGNEEEAASAARSFFSGNFDFVRKIEEESGRIIYMYGYGERTLTTDIDGSLEYRAQLQTDGGAAGGGSYFASLERVLSAVAGQGGFATSAGQGLRPYMAYAAALEDGGYRFELGFTAGGENVYFENGSPIAAEVSDGHLTYFRRYFLNFDEEKTIGKMTEASSPLNVIAGYYENIYTMLENPEIGKGGEEAKNRDEEGRYRMTGSEDRMNYVFDAVCDMTTGYLYIEDENKLKPCHALVLDGGKLTVYFDLETGKWIGQRQRQF